MSQLQFAHYTFNTTTLQLCANGVAVELRPKTAQLLRELILERCHVLPKRELIKRIWHTEHVSDQSVFQAISELRAQLVPLTAIRTFPNRGYQWVLPVAEVNTRRKPVAFAVAATVMVAVAGLFSTTWQPTAVVPHSSAQAHPSGAPVISALPALVTFGEAASALQRGETQRAIDLLQLSVVERPDFVDAKLLLAEAYLLHGEVLEARLRADNVMSSLAPDGNAYSLIAAMDLISRADQQLGQMNSALEWATRAADQANSNGFECTAADLHDRVLALVQDHTYSKSQLEASPVFASRFAQQMLHAALAERSPGVKPSTSLAQSSLPSGDSSREAAFADPMDRLLGRPQPGTRPAHCERFGGNPSGDRTPLPSSNQSLAGPHKVGVNLYNSLI